ncbi:MAG: hypothetical protein ABJC63_09555 [Gemmatimonadales bacterium]
MTEGTVFSINTSLGGVPKLQVADAMVTVMGLYSDSIFRRAQQLPVRAGRTVADQSRCAAAVLASTCIARPYR